MSDNPFEGDPADDAAPAFDPSTPQRFPLPPPTSASNQARLEALRAREAELRDRQIRLQSDRAEIIPSPNFPSFAPVIIFDLDRDIPKRAHSCLTVSLYGLGVLIASVDLNILSILSVRGLYGFHRIRSIVFGLIQGFGTSYVVFNYSFSRLYTYCRRRDIPFSWIVTQFAVVGWLAYLAIGFPDSGCVGLATFLDLLAKSKSTFSMVVAGINTLLVVAAVYFQFLTLYKAQAYQKVSGADEGLLPGQQGA
jgi:hypothetical protein